MQVFKTTLRIILRSPVYLLIYIVGFGLLGLIIGSSVSNSQNTVSNQMNRADALPLVAIIDRDDSVVSRALTEFMADHSTLVALADDNVALQDATAHNLASYILIVPAGFGEQFLAAAKTGQTNLPQLQTVVNFAEADGILMDLLVNRYLQALRLSAALAPEATAAEVLAQAGAAASQQVDVEAAILQDSAAASYAQTFFFLWISYPLSLGLIVLTGTIFSSFRQGELQRRNLSAPLSPTKLSRQIALGCISLVLLAWAFMMLLSLMPAGSGFDILKANLQTFALLAFAVLVFAFVPFSIGFLLSQLGLKEAALNGTGNILALSFSFLSGVFMGGAASLGETMQIVAHVIPTYWYSEAILALTRGGTMSELLSSYFSSLGVVALFAIAIFSVALLLSRRSLLASESAGNTAAEAVA